jgi:uncharacterized membrane protein
MADLENPYQPPAPDVTDALGDAAPDGAYIEGGRAVVSGRGWSWIREGWGYFRRHAGMWVVLSFIFLMLVIAVSLVPVLGWLAAPLLVPVLIAGLLAGCQAVARGGDLELAHLFAGFRRNTGQLVLVGLIGFALTMVAAIPMTLVMGAGVFVAGMSGASLPAVGLSLLLAMLISLALFVPISMATWFAPALVMLQDQSAPRAIGESFRGCLKNIVPFLIYGLIIFALSMIASIPFGLGWLVLMPVVLCSVYAAYRDIFFSA